MQEENKFFSAQTIFRILGFLVLINLLFLDISLFKNKKIEVIEKTIPVQATINSCPSSCIEEINNATKSVSLSSKSQTIVNLLPTSVPTTVQAQTQPSFREFFISLGTGSSSAGDWEDVSGLKVTFDTRNYNDIRTATFEVTIRIPTGNETAYARLYNITDSHPVWFSEVSLEGGMPQLLISKPIILDKGNKTYQVQMKTSLKYPAYIDQSRLHIITQ